MKTEENEIKNYYLKEFSLFDGEYDVTFNILDVNTDKMTITVAITKAGKKKIVNKIANIMTAIESGIFTTSTKTHLEELEKQKEELEGKLLIEKTRVKMIITEDDIITHLKTALKKKPKQMIEEIFVLSDYTFNY